MKSVIVTFPKKILEKTERYLNYLDIISPFYFQIFIKRLIKGDSSHLSLLFHFSFTLRIMHCDLNYST